MNEFEKTECEKGVNDLYDGDPWIALIILLFAFEGNNYKGDEEQCMEITTDITTQQKI